MSGYTSNMPPLESADVSTTSEDTEETEDSIEATDPTFYDMCNQERARNFAKASGGNIAQEETDEILAIVNSIKRRKVPELPTEREDSPTQMDLASINGPRLLNNGELIECPGKQLDIFQTSLSANHPREDDFTWNSPEIVPDDSPPPPDPLLNINDLQAAPISPRENSNLPALEPSTPVNNTNEPTPSPPKKKTTPFDGPSAAKKRKKRKRLQDSRPPPKKRMKRDKRQIEVITITSDSEPELSQTPSPSPPQPIIPIEVEIVSAKKKRAIPTSKAKIKPKQKPKPATKAKPKQVVFKLSRQDILSIVPVVQPPPAPVHKSLPRLVLPHPLPGLILDRKLKVHWDTIPPPKIPLRVCLTLDVTANKYDDFKLVIPFADIEALKVKPHQSKCTMLAECTIKGYVEVANHEDFREYQSRHGRLRMESPGFLWFISEIKAYEHPNLVNPINQSQHLHFEVS